MKADETDFQKIYDEFQPRILHYLTRLAGESEAEDLTQEAFAKISQNLTTFRGESQISTWIYRIATNLAIDKARFAASRKETEQKPLDDPDQVEDRDLWTGEEAPSLERLLMRKEMYECFIDFVKTLPANYRMVVVLADLEEFSNREIAEILGLSLDAIKIRLHRGRARLFQELKAHCKAEDWL